MPRTQQQSELVALAKESLLGNYKQPPLVMARGSGCRMWDVAGRAYLDLYGGIAVSSVGHAHPVLVRAIAEQAATLMHSANTFYNEPSIQLAASLRHRTGYDKVFFCNSGTEANEAMLKLARHAHFARGDTERTELVGTTNGFHGRTYGALSVTGQPKYHEGMRPLVGDTSIVPYDDLDAMRAAVGPRTAAVIVECIQGEGGVFAASDEYLLGLRALCDERGALLLLDEIQTGYGRTGTFLASERIGLRADAVSLAKGIGGGFPLGAMLVSSKLAGALPPGSHGTTFGGNPLACAAGLAVLSILDDEKLVERAATLGAWLAERLGSLAGDAQVPGAFSCRGRGLLQGLVLAPGVDAAATHAAIREAGVLVTLVGGNVLRITPPLVVTREELEEGLATITKVLRDPPMAASAT